ncbi:nuclease-related domain-containing protein [Bacillus salipaludis]|uniref:Nuclease-related domain-containing protein n=1 Tax=Bacillus salipaludis TaxID=2547811 RepID=A0AA90TC32_9BACI|nr:nuclease-related domain-containing protein [Bacillus salipaludis]MDQ6596817.1 nuclease-related domain-containing protein [Bacillus salipaludis]
MQLLKQRTESIELLVMRILNTRMELFLQDKRRYLNLEKGYQGEVIFDKLTVKLESDLYIINDLSLKVNNQVFQIDTLIISQETIFTMEVKNYEGNHYYDSKKDGFFTISNNEIKNPLDQLKSSKFLLRQLLQNIGKQFPVEGYVVFVYLEFTLYEARVNMPIIFPTQLNSFMKKLNQLSSKLNGRHLKVAEQLISVHRNISPYTRLPPYTYERVKKGLTCALCYSFSINIKGNKCVCSQCGHEEKVEFTMLRNIGEIKLLFPDRKVTTSAVYEWCNGVFPKKMVRRVLKANFISIGERHLRYFE